MQENLWHAKRKINKKINYIKIMFLNHRKRIKEIRYTPAREKLKLFENLNIIDANSKKTLCPGIIPYLEQVEDYSEVGETVIAIFFCIMMLLCSITVFFFLRFTFLRFTPQNLLLQFSLCLSFVIPFATIVGFFDAKILRWWIRRKYIKALIIRDLIDILIYEESYPDDWTKTEHKRYLLLSIEWIAIYIEHHLYFQFRSGDSYTDAWLKETMKCVAIALRDKKKWILTPKKDTRDHFLAKIAEMLVIFVEGNWDTLEKKEPEALTGHQMRQFVISYTLKAIRIVAALLFPIVLFISYQKYHQILSLPPLTNTNYTTALILLISTEFSIFASVVIPNFSARLTDVQSMKDLWNK